jgi:uncharacterized FAD-dependent dehydrogenase
MPVTVELKVLPEELADTALLESYAIKASGLNTDEVLGVKIIRQSLDARKQPIVFLVKIECIPKGKLFPRLCTHSIMPTVNNQKTCHIIGFGPAGIYAALQCLELGIKPIILERGKPVEERITDIAAIHKKRVINPDSNYCFGEGGAGTYSDGKLYTRSSKRGDIKKVLDTLIAHGADPKIGIEAHPHIGTNKLPRIIAAMRKTIIEKGGEIYFEKTVTDFTILDTKIKAIKCQMAANIPVKTSFWPPATLRETFSSYCITKRF